VKLWLKLKLRDIFARFTARLLGPHALAIVAQTPQGLFAVDPQDFDVGRQLRHSGQWGQGELDLLTPYLSPEAEILVVGAHIGSLVVPLARRCQRLVAIEANPHSFELLSLNLRLNQILNCETHCLAASQGPETLRFLANPSSTGGSKRMPVIKNNLYFYDHPAEISVEAVALDDLLHGQRFDLILMDIEGSEYFALLGMQSLLSKARVLQIEFLPHHLKQVSAVSVADFLSPLGKHFQRLFIPSQQRWVEQAAFLQVLSEMFDQNRGDDGLIFLK